MKLMDLIGKDTFYSFDKVTFNFLKLEPNYYVFSFTIHNDILLDTSLFDYDILKSIDVLEYSIETTYENGYYSYNIAFSIVTNYRSALGILGDAFMDKRYIPVRKLKRRELSIVAENIFSLRGDEIVAFCARAEGSSMVQYCLLPSSLPDDSELVQFIKRDLRYNEDRIVRVPLEEVKKRIVEGISRNFLFGIDFDSSGKFYFVYDSFYLIFKELKEQ